MGEDMLFYTVFQWYIFPAQQILRQSGLPGTVGVRIISSHSNVFALSHVRCVWILDLMLTALHAPVHGIPDPAPRVHDWVLGFGFCVLTPEYHGRMGYYLQSRVRTILTFRLRARRVLDLDWLGS